MCAQCGANHKTYWAGKLCRQKYENKHWCGFLVCSALPLTVIAGGYLVEFFPFVWNAVPNHALHITLYVVFVTNYRREKCAKLGIRW